MKKVAAFITALILFVGTALSVHTIAGEKLDTNNPFFGTWISTKKDLSYKAVSSNIEKDTVMMMGSSEFQYGNKTPYHPTNIFRKLGMNVMCIGAAQNQSLSHAVTLGAVAPKLENKKVVLILSPTWFSKTGAESSGFSARFSESMYEQMLANDELSQETRNAIADRVDQMLQISPDTQASARTARSMIAGGRVSLKDRIAYRVEKWINTEKEDINVGLLWKASGGKNYHEYTPAKAGEEPDWDKLAKEADESMAGKVNNQFHMLDKLYKSKIKPEMKNRKNADVNRTFADSPEYDDLRLFLDVCKEEGIEAMLVLLPINGWWYDYTGFPKDQRETVVQGVEKVASEYGAKVCSFFDECYTPGFLEDNVHPAGKGWVRINEEAYKFYKEV